MIQTTHYLKPEWPAPDCISAYATTRAHPFGKSQGSFSTFNLSLHVGDEETAVNENRKQLAEDLHLPEPPRWLNQVHSNKVIDIVEYNYAQIPEADACFTNKKNTVCPIMTADCLPILLCNQQGHEIAAIHAGWRGLLAGVIPNTIVKMQSSPHELFAWLGPAIGPNVFQVNEQIKVDFLHSNPHNSDCFTTTKDQSIFANIYQIAKNELNCCGVQNIFGGNRCTFSEPELFYSYRRDQHITGRMATLIWIDQLT